MSRIAFFLLSMSSPTAAIIAGSDPARGQGGSERVPCGFVQEAESNTCIAEPCEFP